MRVAVCSIFYNSVTNKELPGYIAQCEALDWPHDELRFCLAEGDSADNTWAELAAWNGRDARVRAIKLDLHEPYLGSVPNPRRLRNCSTMAGAARSLALRDEWADAVLWVESDLLWEPDLLKRLAAVEGGYVAPWVLFAPGGQGCKDPAKLRNMSTVFYDSWGFRYLDGRLFGGSPRRPDAPFEVSSAGSVLFARREVVSVSNTPNEQAVIGWCEQARAAGHKVIVDPTTEVFHPWPKGA